MLVREVVDTVRNEWLEGTYATVYNALDAPLDSTNGSLTLKYNVAGCSPGGLLAIGDELCSIVAVTTNEKRVEVVRGVRGTPRSEHLAGAVVEPNPRYWRALIRTAAYQELWSWPNRIYRRESVRGILAVGDLAVEVRPGSGLAVRLVIDFQRAARHTNDARSFKIAGINGHRVAHNVARDGDCWVYLDNPTPWDGLAYVAHVGTDWNTNASSWTDSTDLTDVGLDDSLASLLILGTTWRLIVGREARRLQMEAQGQSRTPGEVPAGSTATLGLRLKALRDEAIEQEAARLSSRALVL